MSLGERRQSVILPAPLAQRFALWRRQNAVVLEKETWILLQEPQGKTQNKVSSSKTKKNIAEGLLESFRKKFLAVFYYRFILGSFGKVSIRKVLYSLQ